MCPKIPARQWLTQSFLLIVARRRLRKLGVKLRIFYLEVDDADPMTINYFENPYIRCHGLLDSNERVAV